MPRRSSAHLAARRLLDRVARAAERRPGHGRRKKPVDDSFLAVASAHTSMVAAEIDLGTFLVDPADRSKAKLFASGRVDDRVLAAALHVARRLSPRDGATFVDVGAHVGLLTVAALRRHGFARAVALEAEPGNFRLLRMNLALNELEDAARPVHVAVSEQAGSARMRLNAHMHGKHALLAQDEPAPAGVIEVATRPLDDLLAELAIDVAEVGFLKVDTEGHETAVLRGAGSLLAAGVPALVEYAPFRLVRAPGGLDAFEAVVCEHWSHFVDVRAAEKAGSLDAPPEPVDRLARLRTAYDGQEGRRRVTDLLFLP